MPTSSDNPYLNLGSTTFDESRGFVGLDLFQNPQDLASSYLMQADNCNLLAGMLPSRPGINGVFGASNSSPGSVGSSYGSGNRSSGSWYSEGDTFYTVPSGPCYGIASFTDTSGNMWIVFTDSNGRIYKTLRGSQSYTELLTVGGGHYNFTPGSLDASRPDGFLYLVDGSHPLTRLNLSGGYPAYSMIAPAQSPAAVLTSNTLFAANTGSQWSFDGQATAINTSIVTANLLNTGAWTVTNSAGPGYGTGVNMINAAVNICLAGGSDATGAFLAVSALSGSTGESPNLYPSRFHFLIQGIKDGQFHGQGNSYSANVIITAFDSNQNNLGQGVFNVNPAQGATTLFDTVFDFSGAGATVAYLKVQMVKSSDSNSGNLWLANALLYPITVQTQIISGATSTVFIPSISGGLTGTSPGNASSSSSSSLNAGGQIVPTSTTDIGAAANILDYQETSWTFTFPGSPVDLSTTDRLVIGLNPNAVASWGGQSTNGVDTTGLNFALTLLQTGGGAYLADNGTSISADSTGLDCDISTLTVAERQNITGLKLTFLSNILWGSPNYAFQLGPVLAPGNLSIGDSPYTYYVTETAQMDSVNNIESNPSLPSVQVLPTFAQATGSITIPSDCPKNPASTQYNLYRQGGAWSDIRLIATVNIGSTVAMGADPSNPYYAYSAGVFTDNTPDLFLTGVALMSFSKDPMPANAQAIATWQGRNWVAVGNTIYCSWLYASTGSAALLTTLVQNPNDPNFSIAGFNTSLSPDPSDTVVRMIPYGTPVVAGNEFGGGLLVLCQRSVWVVQGLDASNFSIQQLPYSDGVGLVARRGVTVISPNEIAFLGPDRIHQFPLKLDNPLKDFGLPIQPQLYPNTTNGTLQIPSAFANAFAIFHDAAMYVCVPLPGGSSNSVIWKYDFRSGPGWTRWSQFCDATPNDTFNMAFTSAMSLPPNAASGSAENLYLWGTNGQMSLVSGTTDSATPISGAVNIAFSITVNAKRPGFFYRYKRRVLYYILAMLEWWEIEAVMNGTLTATAQAYTYGPTGPAAIAGAKTVQPYLLAGTGEGYTQNAPSGLIEGQYLTLQLTGSVSQQAILRGVRGWITGTSTQAD